MCVFNIHLAVLFVAIVGELDAVFSVSLWPAGQQHSEKGSAETSGLATAKYWPGQPHPGTHYSTLGKLSSLP